MFNISIIIPFYNDLENINHAINSVFSQKTKLKYEIIIVNNGKKNIVKKNYLELLKLYSKKVNIKIINTNKIGASWARNIGIRESNGKYLLFLDSDDYLEKNILSKLEKDILRNDYDMIKFCANRIKENKIIEKIDGFNYQSFDGKKMLVKLISFNERIFSPVWLYCINKEMFFNNNIWFSKNMYHEDYRIISHLLMFSKKTKSYDFIGYNYVHRNGSITRNNNYNIKKKKSFDFISHSLTLLKIGKRNLDVKDFIIFRDYIIKQSYRKFKYLNVLDKKKFYKKIVYIEKKYSYINFSVILPVYNSEKTIDRAIKSILNQDYKNYEIIVINDGCSDDTINLLNKYKSRKNFKIINQKNKGQSEARNNGIKIATGEYLIFLDSDDTFEKRTFKKLELEIIKNMPDLIYSNKFNKISNVKKEINLDKHENIIKNYILGSPGPYSKIIKKNLIEKFPKFKRYEDLAIIPLYALKANELSKIDFSFYNYYKTVGSIMHRNNKNFEYLNESLLFLYKKIINYEIFLIYQEEYEFLFIKNLLYFSLLRSNYTNEEIEKYLIGINILKTKFPNWESNKYLNFQTEEFKKYVNLIKLNRFEDAISFFKSKGVKIK